jgi:peptidoglycan/xylan/chitin deacetylase (PgdA/CDA1 family)
VVRALGIGAAALACFFVPAASTSGHSRPVPILMYHLVTTPPPGVPNTGLYVPEREFAAEMRWLAQNGYRAVTLRRVYDYWRYGRPLPPHPIVLSFDDGYRSVYLNAFPLMRARGWPGVLNLEIRHEHHSWGLLPRVVRALIRHGWELDSHTITHPDLTTVGQAQLKTEVAGSRRILRSQYHAPVDFFCYPAGAYDDAVITAVQAAGYLGATSTRYGLARPSDLWTLARIRVSPGEGAAGLAARLRTLGA